MKTKFKFSTLVLSIVLFNSVPAFAKLKVVTTLPSFADIASQVGGDEVSVTPLLKGTQDPHFVDARPDLVLTLNRADLLVHAGLGLEEGWLPPLLLGSRNSKIQLGSAGNFDVSTVMELREVPKGKVDRASGDVHPGGNPHYMLDPRNGIELAQAIALKLGELEPSKAAEFTKRADDYVKKLKAKIAGWEKQYKSLSGLTVVTYHRSWSYFVGWLGLNVPMYVEPKPGVMPSPQHVVQLVNLMKLKKIKLILMEPFYPKGVAEDVARQTGAKLLVLPTEVNGTAEAKTYIDLFEQILMGIQNAVKPATS